ncbi:T9SS type A sorting domain-containing protein [Lacinutrix salivirga]
MKKITLLFFVAVLSSLTAMAQYSFPAVAGPTNVANGTPVTLNINDAANTAGATAGSYLTFTVTADWVAGGGGPWSSEADLTVTTAAGSVSFDSATSGDASSGAATSLSFDGAFTAPYDPSTDGTLTLELSQSYGGSDADWSNIVVTIVACLPPAATTAVVDDCANNQFTIDVDVTDLGSATSVSISNDAGVAATTGITAIGMQTVGPFPAGTAVNLTLEHDQDAGCNVDLGSSLDGCPSSNDECTGALPIACGDTVTGSTVAATDSGNNAAFDVFYSFTDTVLQDVTLSLCNSSYDTYIRVFDDCPQTNEIAGNDDSCGTRSEVTFTAQPNTTYYIMVEGYAGTEGAFELSATCIPNVPAPGNDLCSAATPLDLGVPLTGETTAGATDDSTGTTDDTTCQGFTFKSDVWYTIVAPTSGEVTIETTATGTSTAASIALYPNCTQLDSESLGCNVGDATGATLAVVGLTGGTTYYVRVWSDGVAARGAQQRVEGTFDISAVDTTLSTVDFDNGSLFSYYPNPVNNTLSLQSQKEISNVAVFNMLGQEVLRNAPNTVNNDVDMSNLQSGAYFVQVTISGTTETIRVIKN